jgi:hypothetical protein
MNVELASILKKFLYVLLQGKEKWNPPLTFMPQAMRKTKTMTRKFETYPLLHYINPLSRVMSNIETMAFKLEPCPTLHYNQPYAPSKKKD